jgi:hypothetical protein
MAHALATNPESLPGLFALPEYDRAFTEFLHEAIHAVARARDPILSQIRVEEVQTIGTSRISGEEQTVDLPPIPAAIELSFEADDLIHGRVPGILAVIDDAADQHLRQVMPGFFESIARITDATGNKVDAGGRPFSPELLLEALEKIEWSFDEDGEPIMPTLVMSPDMADTVSKLPPLTPEQEQAFAELKERKRAEYRARRRHRKLS